MENQDNIFYIDDYELGLHDHVVVGSEEYYEIVGDVSEQEQDEQNEQVA